MKVNWILQTDVFGENIEELKFEIKNQGHTYEIVEYVPFSSNNSCLSLDFDGPTLFYGSINLGQQILNSTNWYPGVYLDKSKYFCSYYYNYLYDYLVNKECLFIPFGLLSQKQLYSHLAIEDFVFARPDGGTKSFTGQLIDLKDKNFINKLKAFGTWDNEMVLISSPKVLQKEWRLIVTDKVITGSQYKQDGKVLESELVPTEVLEYANNLLFQTKFRPEPIWTLDICQQDGILSVLELGCFSCAGFYKSNIPKIVNEASKQAIVDWEDLHN